MILDFFKDINRMLSPLNILTNMSTTNLCFERSNLSLSAHLSLNFSLKEFASGIESVNELILDEINEITCVANDEINENYNGDKVQNSVANHSECSCWSSERMKQFIDYMRTTFESPLINEIERLNERNNQLSYDLKKNLTFIENQFVRPIESEKFTDLKNKYSERFDEICTLQKKLAKQTLVIEEYVKNEEENFELINKKSEGNYENRKLNFYKSVQFHFWIALN